MANIVANKIDVQELDKPKQLMEYTAEVSLAMYNGRVLEVVFTNDLVKSASRRGSYANANWEACATGYHRVIFYPNPRSGVVAHEAWHIVYDLLSCCNIPLQDEVVAYLLTYLVDEIEKVKNKELVVVDTELR